MRKIGLIVLFLGLLFLSGCGKDRVEPELIEFDDYAVVMQKHILYQQTQPVKINNSFLSPDIIGQYYLIDDDTGFQDTILILKLDGNSLSVGEFAEEQLEKTEQLGWNLDSSGDEKFVCGEDKIEARLAKLDLKSDTQDLYFVQYFFQNKGSNYIISYASDIKKSQKDWAKAVKGIYCMEVSS